MKRRLCALLLSGTLLLSGCSALLSQEYTSVTPHSAAPTADAGSDTLRADSYQELVNILLYLVTLGEEEASIRLYNTQDPEDELERACLEVVQEDPLGAYAVDYIKYSITPIVASYQAGVQIFFRRSKEQIDSIVSVTGATAIRSELKEVLSSFGQESVLRVSNFEGDEEYLRSLVEEAYYAVPQAALGMPKTEIALYPREGGEQRVVEISISYPLSSQELLQRQQALEHEARLLGQQLEGTSGNAAVLAAAKLVLEYCRLNPESGSTAYDALLLGEADSQGLALALALIATQQGITCQVVAGSLDGQPHFWNVISTREGYRHLDLTAQDAGLLSTDALKTDPALEALGYQWNTASVPPCREFTGD